MLRLQDLIKMPEEDLAKLDIAEVNLTCAVGLPGAESIDFKNCLDRLDHYARCIRHFTNRQLHVFRSDPVEYDCSEAKFRVVCLIRMLYGQYGVRYNPAKRSKDAIFETADTFTAHF